MPSLNEGVIYRLKNQRGGLKGAYFEAVEGDGF